MNKKYVIEERNSLTNLALEFVESGMSLSIINMICEGIYWSEPYYVFESEDFVEAKSMFAILFTEIEEADFGEFKVKEYVLTEYFDDSKNGVHGLEILAFSNMLFTVNVIDTDEVISRSECLNNLADAYKWFEAEVKDWRKNKSIPDSVKSCLKCRNNILVRE